jgi:hypothetical protein
MESEKSIENSGSLSILPKCLLQVVSFEQSG